MSVIIHTQQEMEDLGVKLVKNTDKFLLYGELGSGKTTLVKGLAAWLGIDTTQVQSPTYTYLHIYEEKLLHIDMRRIETQKQFLELGILELIEHYPFVAIERPKRENLYADPTWLTVSLHTSWSVKTFSQEPFTLLDNAY